MTALTLRSSDNPDEWVMSESFACANCGISFNELTPQMFSFNAPQGACPTCAGLGTRLEVDPELLVPNPELSLHNGAVVYWGELRKKKDSWGYRALRNIARHFEFDLDTPVERAARPRAAHFDLTARARSASSSPGTAPAGTAVHAHMGRRVQRDHAPLPPDRLGRDAGVLSRSI